MNQEIFPKPFQSSIPIWIGSGGSQNSFIRAGILGLPLMIAIIGSYMGLNATAGAKGVGLITKKSVVSSLIVIFIRYQFMRKGENENTY